MAEQPFKLVVGGDVQAHKGTYLRRDVDEHLYQACLDGKFAYVLACRQIGKSSLKNAVAERLAKQGIREARIDLNRIGRQVEHDSDWYFSLITEIARRLQLGDVLAWWEAQPPHSTMSQRFLHFIDEVLLQQIQAQIVIFIDEIDVTLGRSFTDDLFASIRSLYNDRAQNDAYQRISFVLLGAAAPDELINDSARTPFNIGTAVAIHDFAKEELAQPLAEAIETKHVGKGWLYFDQIFAWTNGHPFLTQKLCAAVMAATDASDTLVDQQVKAIFLNDAGYSEDNLHFVQTRVLKDTKARAMLDLYKRILKGRDVPDNQKSLVINRLKLYGLVKSEKGLLRVRNRIYQSVFDLAWHKKHYPVNWSRRIAIFAVSMLFAILLFSGYVVWNNTIRVPGNAAGFDKQFRDTPNSDVQLDALVNLYELNQSLILLDTNQYAEQADWLISRLRVEEQIALFHKPHNRSHVVIQNQYTELVDLHLLETETEHNSDGLLQAMAGSMTGAERSSNSALAEEVRNWADARQHLRVGAYEEALSSYNRSLEINPDNYATLYERALLLLHFENVEEALRDLSRLEQLLDSAIIVTPTPALATETPTQVPTPTPTPLATSTSLADERAQGDNTLPSALGIVSPTVPPTTINATSVRYPGIIERVTPVQLLNAVQRLLLEESQFRDISNTMLVRYPNLVALGLPTSVAVAVTTQELTSAQPTSLEPIAVQPTESAMPSEQSAIIDTKIRRISSRENTYVMTGTGIETVALGDLLVVYVQDVAGFESDVAVVYIVDKNRDNLQGKVIFQNPDVALDSLAALRADNNLADANLTRMVAIDAAFVGFTVAPNRIRLNPNESIQSGTELLAVGLTANGDAILISPPVVLQISTVSFNKEMANASVVGGSQWPPVGTLLIPRNARNTYMVSVNDFSATNEVCVRKGDRVKVNASGMITTGEFVGILSPEGKESFQLLGITAPIDPLWDIVPEFPHGVLMFRIADSTWSATEGWMDYAATKGFTAERSGCLEFDINDNDNSDNTGAYSVQIDVNP